MTREEAIRILERERAGNPPSPAEHAQAVDVALADMCDIRDGRWVRYRRLPRPHGYAGGPG